MSSWLHKSAAVALAIVASLATTAASARAVDTSSDYVAVPAIPPELIDTSRPDAPPPPEPLDIPDGIFPSQAELDQRLVDSVPWDEFERIRSEKGYFAKLSRSAEVAQDLIDSHGEYGVPLLAHELPARKAFQAKREKILRFNARIVDADGFLHSRIDDSETRLQVWGVRTPEVLEVIADAPSGVEFLEASHSRSELERARTEAGLFDLGDDLGLSIQAVRLKPEGFVVEVADSLTGKAPAQSLIQEIGSLARERLRRISVGDASPEVTVVGVEDFGIRQEICDFTTIRRHCSNAGGGNVFDGCTAGYTLRSSSSADDRALSTAGHCGVRDRFEVSGPDTTDPAYTAEELFTSLVAASVDNEFMDVQARRPALASQRGLLVATYYMDNTYANRPLTAVRAAPPDGLDVCLSGRWLAARRCGEITDPDFDNDDTTNWIQIDWDSAAIGTTGGDSGSSITEENSPGTAVAIHANAGLTSPNAPYWNTRAFSPRADLIDDYYSGWRPLTDSVDTALDDSYAARLYRTALQRSGSVANVTYWSTAIDPGSECLADAKWVTHYFLTNGELEAALPISGSAATENAERRVRRLYAAAYNTVADSAGFAYWRDVLVNSSNPEQAWDWMADHFVYDVSSTSTQLQGTVNRERGPC